MRARRRVRVGGTQGFTLIEVLIAVVVVSVGLLGILALVANSLKVAGDVVQDSMASTIARSVYESLREGTRKRGFLVREGPVIHYVRGFTFLHDGSVRGDTQTAPPLLPRSLNGAGIPAPDTTDTDTVTKLTALRASNYAVFLPPAPPVGATGTSEKLFIFPRPTDPATENAAEQDNYLTTTEFGHSGERLVLDVQKVYELSLNKSLTLPTATAADQVAATDATDQYSFAFAIRRAAAPNLVDNSGNPFSWTGASSTIAAGAVPAGAAFPPGSTASGEQVAQDGLYIVEIMVFRNFPSFQGTGSPTPADITAMRQSRYYNPVPGGRFFGLLTLGF